MDEWINFFLSNQVLAVAVPTLIFFVTVFLVVRRAVGFFLTLLFMLFALASGLAIVNYDVVRTYITENRRDISGLENEFRDMKRELQRVFEDLQSDLNDQRQNARKVLASGRDMLDEMDKQTAEFQAYMQDQVLPALKEATERREVEIPEEKKEPETE